MTAPVVEATAGTWRYRLRADATVSLDGDRRFVATQTAALGLTSPAHLAAVRDLAAGSCTELDLAASVMAQCGEAAAFGLQMLLQKLHRDGWLEYELSWDGAPLVRLRPLGHAAGPSERPVKVPDLPVHLSRFAVLRAVEETMRIESPRSTAAIVLTDPRCVALAGALAAPLPRIDAVAGLPVDAAAAVLALLQCAGMLDDGDEESQQQLAQWSLPDLLLHSSSRAGRRDGGYGGSYRLAGRFPSLPALAPRRDGAAVPLPVPDLEAVAATDPPLTTVIEQRRSIRRHDPDAPITLAQLGELLYRTCRTRRVYPIDHDEVADRPYPAGGALHELEIYPVVTACDGLEPGLWHYASGDHELEFVSEPTPAVRALVGEARFAGVMDADPQVLLVVAARFGRVMWKYESVAYAIVLKNVGVLYQTLYLVATAMGLGACGLGGGNSDRFAEATGLDYYAETSVGEFLIGSRLPDETGGWP